MHLYFSILNLLTAWVMMAQLQQGVPDEKEKTTALKGMNTFAFFSRIQNFQKQLLILRNGKYFDLAVG